MYNCQKCRKTSLEGQKIHKVVTAIRNRVYQNGSKGTEIVSEKSVCGTCAPTYGAPKTVN